MLSQTVREALESELEHLQLQRKKLDAKIQALAAVLSPLDELGIFQPELPGMKVAKPESNSGELSGKGLREAIRNVMASYPSGVLPGELATKMEEMGYTPGGKTPTKTLVYGELYRLKRLGKVQKKSKRFILVPENKGAIQSNQLST